MNLLDRLRLAKAAFQGKSVLQGRILIRNADIQTDQTIVIANGTTIQGSMIDSTEDVALHGVGKETVTVTDSYINTRKE